MSPSFVQIYTRTPLLACVLSPCWTCWSDCKGDSLLWLMFILGRSFDGNKSKQITFRRSVGRKSKNRPSCIVLKPLLPVALSRPAIPDLLRPFFSLSSHFFSLLFPHFPPLAEGRASPYTPRDRSPFFKHSLAPLTRAR